MEDDDSAEEEEHSNEVDEGKDTQSDITEIDDASSGNYKKDVNDTEVAKNNF